MKVVKANVRTIDEQDILKKIEQCGRICYKSEEQIKEGSALPFVSMLIQRNHLAMLEHAPLVLKVTQKMANDIKYFRQWHIINVSINTKEDRYMVSGNVRAWRELFCAKEKHSKYVDLIERYEIYMQMSLGEKLYCLLFPNIHKCNTNYNYLLTQEDILNLPHLEDYEAKEHLYLTAHFICDRGVSHELVRHRPASFAQESTRYCNYSRDIFGTEITCIDPGFTKYDKLIWRHAMRAAEEAYFCLLKSGKTPQEARGVLPTDLKTEIIMTCNLYEWQHVINLRYHGTTGAPHPHMLEVMSMWYKIIQDKEGYNNWID